MQRKNTRSIKTNYTRFRNKIMNLPGYLQQEMFPILYAFFIHIVLHFNDYKLLEEQRSFIQKFRDDFTNDKQKEIDKVIDDKNKIKSSLIEINLTKIGYEYLMDQLNSIDDIVLNSILEKYIKINFTNNHVKNKEIEIMEGKDDIKLPNLGHVTVYNYSSLVSNIKVSKSLQLLAIPNNSSIYIHSLDEDAYFPNRSNVFKITNHTSQIVSSEFSPSSRFIASSSFDCDIRVSDTEVCRQISHFKYHSFPVLDLSYDDRGFFLSAASQDRTISIWNSTNSLILRQLIGHKQPVIKTVFSHKKSELYSLSTDCTITKWDIGSAKSIFSFSFNEFNPTSLDVHPFKDIIACGDLKGSVIIYDLENNNYKVIRNFYTRVSDVKFSSDGKKLISSSTNGAIRVYELEDDTISNIINIPDSTIDSICKSNYSELFVTSGKSTKYMESDNKY